MPLSPVAVLTAVAALASATVGGLYYAFSTFVMRGLDRTSPVDAITAMRGIDAEAQANPPFLLLFLGSALLAVIVGVVAVIQFRQPGSAYLLAGAICAVIPTVVTMTFNVPLNDHLDSVDPAGLSAADATREWHAYLDPWMAWNHIRTIAALVGATLFTMGLYRR